MTVLAFDPSLTRTGFAYRYDEETGPKSANLGSIVPPEGCIGMRRLQYILHKVQELSEEVDPAVVAYEGYAMGKFSGGGRYFDLGELGGVLKLYFYETGTPVLLVPPSSLKKFITGKGNADKEQVRKVTARDNGALFKNLDESDAYGLLLMGEAYENPRLLPRIKTHFKREALAGCELLKCLLGNR